MKKERNNIIDCSAFEEMLTDYIDKTLDASANTAAAAHALACPLCHTLLNDVKDSLEVCHALAEPKMPLTRLEARILEKTMPETALACEEFEGYLTDYLDGFLPASVFHRWERHAVLCGNCEDLPGMVVRSIAACFTYKMDEVAVPAGLTERILDATSRATDLSPAGVSLLEQVREWLSGIRLPLPQLAPVAMMLLLAFMMFSQSSSSADGSVTNVYQKSLELAELTYQQSADAWNGRQPTVDQTPKQDPVTGTTFVEDKK